MHASVALLPCVVTLRAFITLKHGVWGAGTYKDKVQRALSEVWSFSLENCIIIIIIIILCQVTDFHVDMIQREV